MNITRSLRATMLAAAVAATAAPLMQQTAMAYEEPSVSAVDVKPVGFATNTWGHFPHGSNIDTWTEVQVNGEWSVSQRGETNSGGSFVLPLTYGTHDPGKYEYRVGGKHDNGTVVYSDSFTLTRAAKPTTASAGAKPVNVPANVWGTVDHGSQVEAWTEVNLGNRWSRSQITKTNSSGYYVIPLTYGAGMAGTQEFRVAARHDDGSVSRSKPFTFTRWGEPTASSASSKEVGETTYAWGLFPGGSGIEVWSEAMTSNGWSVSQRARTNTNGSFTIPLTYGANTVGTHTFRIGGRYPDGSTVYTNQISLKRTAKPVAAPISGSGDKYDWMRAAGIPESQWQYADYIVSRESGWNPRAVNPYSGACGLAQAYPCSKLGPNWYDPVVALKWQYNYVTERYGGYQGAYNFWVRNRWY